MNSNNTSLNLENNNSNTLSSNLISNNPNENVKMEINTSNKNSNTNRNNNANNSANNLTNNTANTANNSTSNQILNENNFWNSMDKLEVNNVNNNNTNNNNNMFKKLGNKTVSDEDYYQLLCEYKGSNTSISYNIITDLIGLFFAYRSVNRLPRGLSTNSFILFYLVIAVVAIYEVAIHLIYNKDKAQELCKEYYKWLDDHRVVKILLNVVRWILFIVIFIFGFISFFTDLDYKSQNKSKNNNKYKSLHNNRNYNNRNYNNRNRNNKNNNNRYNNNRN